MPNMRRNTLRYYALPGWQHGFPRSREWRWDVRNAARRTPHP